MKKVQDILIKKINVELLREQRDSCLKLLTDMPSNTTERNHLLGLVNMIDAMLDEADGI